MVLSMCGHSTSGDQQEDQHAKDKDSSHVRKKRRPRDDIS
jgi:hypothetical protein